MSTLDEEITCVFFSSFYSGPPICGQLPFLLGTLVFGFWRFGLVYCVSQRHGEIRSFALPVYGDWVMGSVVQKTTDTLELNWQSASATERCAWEREGYPDSGRALVLV